MKTPIRRLELRHRQRARREGSIQAARDTTLTAHALTYKLLKDTSASDRARMQVLAMATAALSQRPAWERS
ncbi:hypothetical protein [Streptomyces sp. 1222.5]|uniref:hypothetical protein n=1 Tax=Streptomyces sp. 1222.5 TaxID=1881026 RepID=UPI003EC0139D